MTYSFDQKEFKRIAKTDIEDGKSRQEIYDWAVAQEWPSTEVANTLVNLPSAARWKKYKIWNTIYLIALILLGLINLLSPSAALVINAAFIYIVATKKFKYYHVCVAVNVLGLVIVIASVLARGSMPLSILFLSVGTIILYIVPGIMLPKLLVPPYLIEDEIYVDEEGYERLRHKHVFID